MPPIPKLKIVHIEVIEDDKTLSKALYEEFQDAGFEVAQAFNGADGLKLAQTEKPDLILLDVILPTKNGFEVLQELKKSPLTEKIPVLVLTMLGQEEDIKKLTALGAAGYIVKSEKALSQVVEEVKAFFKEQQ